MKKLNLYIVVTLLAVAQLWAVPNDMSLARKYYKDEVYKTAAYHYRKFLEENPPKEDIADARLGLARSLSRLNDLENSARIYQDFIVSHANHGDWAEANYELAEVHQNMGNHSKAGELYYNYSRLKQNKKSEQAMYFSTVELYSAQEFETAQNYANQYLEKFPNGKNLAGIMLILGKVSGREGAWNEAKEYLLKAINLKPESNILKTSHWYLARTFVQLQEKNRAQAEYLKVLEQANSQDSIALVKEYSSFLYISESFQDLEKFLGSRKAVSLNSREQLYLAEARVKIKKYQAALMVLEQMQMAEDDVKVKVEFLKAESLIGMGDRAEGIQVLLTQGKKGNSEAYIRAAEAYVRDGMFQQAIQSYYNAMEYIKDDIQSIPLILKIAAIYENDLKRYSVARSVYEDFSKNYPSSPQLVDASMGIARCLYKEDKLRESARAYQRVMEDFPLNEQADNARLNYNYISDFLLKDNDAATNDMLLILEKGDYPEKNLHIARVLEKDLKLYDKAYEVYQRYISVAKDAETVSLAYYRCGRIQELLSDKAFFEKHPQKLSKHKNLAVANYQSLIKHFPKSVWRDDAEFRILELNDFSLKSYEDFVINYSTSNCLPDVLLKIGDSYQEKSHFQGAELANKAITYYHQILNNFPDSELKEKALLGVSKSYVISGTPQKAEASLNILISNDKIDKNIQASAWLLKGEISFNNKDYVDARKNFKEVLFRFGASTSAPKALFMEAKSYDHENKNKDAINTYRKYIANYSSGENIYETYVNISKVYQRENKFNPAIAILSEYLQRNKSLKNIAPNAASVWERMANLYQLQNAKVQAVDAYRNAIQYGNGTKNHLLLSSAELLLSLDRFDSAQVYFENALTVAQNYRDSAQAYGGIGPCLVMRNKGNEFVKYQKDFKKKYKKENELFARMVYYEGRHLMETRQESRARKRFNLLANRYEETSWAGEGVYYLGSIAFKKGSYKSAVKELREYIEKNPKGRSIADAYFRLGSAYFQLKEYRLAVSNYHKSLGYEKSASLIRYRASYNAALAHEKLDEWDQSAKLYSDIYKFYPDFTDGGVLVSAGFAYYNANQLEKAKSSFKLALSDSTHERKAEAHYWYAKSLDRLNDVDNAVAEYLKVNYLYPNDPMWGLTSLFDVGQIYERSGMIDKAKKMYQRIVTQDGLHGSLGSRAAKYLKQMELKESQPNNKLQVQ